MRSWLNLSASFCLFSYFALPFPSFIFPFQGLVDYVLSGKISQVIAECDTLFPGFLSFESPHKEVYFELQTQQFLEMLRSQTPTDQLLNYAQKELAPFGFIGASYFEQLRVLYSSSSFLFSGLLPRALCNTFFFLLPILILFPLFYLSTLLISFFFSFFSSKRNTGPRTL